MADLPDFPKIRDIASGIPIPDLLRMPPVSRNPVVDIAESNYASEFHRRLVEWISAFDATLDAAHEVGVRLVTFGREVVFRLDDLGYYNPSLISFRGHTDDGAPVELVQHVSQISILLMRLPRENPNEPKKAIGFNS